MTQGLAPYNIKKFDDIDYYTRLSLGLPIVLPTAAHTPWGYTRDEEDKRVCWPNDREIRCLKKAYELIEEGVGYRQIVRWVMQNTQKSMSTGTLYNLYKYRRPLCKEVELDIDERQRIYRTAQAETKASKIINEASNKKEVRDLRDKRRKETGRET